MSVSTLAMSRDLESKGFEKIQAEGLAEAIVTAVDASTQDLVTKDFLKAEISEVRTELKAEISDAKYTMVKWGIGLFALGISLNATLTYFLNNFMFKHLTDQIANLAQQVQMLN